MKQEHVLPGDAESGQGAQHELSADCWCRPVVERVPGRRELVQHDAASRLEDAGGGRE